MSKPSLFSPKIQERDVQIVPEHAETSTSRRRSVRSPRKSNATVQHCTDARTTAHFAQTVGRLPREVMASFINLGLPGLPRYCAAQAFAQQAIITADGVPYF